jgi:hypothetical protein
MNRKYDLFEKFPDGSSLWRACVLGLEGTRLHLQELANNSKNRFYAIDIWSGKIVAPNLEYRDAHLAAARKMGRRNKSACA